MKHPSTAKLALYAGGDLAWIAALRVRFHLSRCGRCRQQVRAFAELRGQIASAARELPPEIDWNRLAAEMRANIRLGLTAGAIANHALAHEAVAEPEMAEQPAVASPLRWSLAAAWLPGAAVVASLTLVVALVWLLSHPPVSFAPDMAGNGHATVVTALGTGLEVRMEGAALTLLAPPSGHGALAVDLGAGARAEYVDAETGQMTIHQVYYGDDE